MSGAETARRPVVQRQIGSAESAAPKRRCRNGPPPVFEWVLQYNVGLFYGVFEWMVQYNVGFFGVFLSRSFNTMSVFFEWALNLL